MAAGVKWDGLNEFKRDLRNLPADLAKETADIVVAHGEQAQRLLQAEYATHAVTGNLWRGVTLERYVTKDRVEAKVRSRAPHSHIFEWGTKQRRTRRGWKRGAMPAAHIAVPIFQRVRAAMYRAIVPVLERAGFKVAA